MSDQKADKSIEQIHKEACDLLQDSYLDPETGYTVFTAVYHKARGYCCKSGCRHCPYGFVPEKKGTSFLKRLVK